ncbi:uncharacterized protein K460DRAFT_359903 [Cucurbitaria berberidis CBS 394.84]|uniref:Uncharacterized protein n=1 Tax=Cucurbitaria berberidis CBS 394.84 TaxID=1168544 RepID=A0A9P4G767_9PLEO|nr:uncharacterized protein K460DRAFT_359903 [Cucurbitaria berberidis CBS 394.84]KAF1840192.1 hypothetical protein K460DRAFT_359903 [Cucurbitaria berberidis CBS 394.84]
MYLRPETLHASHHPNYRSVRGSSLWNLNPPNSLIPTCIASSGPPLFPHAYIDYQSRLQSRHVYKNKLNNLVLALPTPLHTTTPHVAKSSQLTLATDITVAFPPTIHLLNTLNTLHTRLNRSTHSPVLNAETPIDTPAKPGNTLYRAGSAVVLSHGV